ncbi:glucuronate isomerase [Akkermansiaceae bacterium]|nr:glucuronate isomerase [Akkermansiaceae bacterium]
MLLTSDIAREIYSSIKDEPIIDYHTHLPVADILNDHRFENLWELWLKHDHYKWRLMRGCGVPERFITGAGSPHEKFLAFAEILPLAIGNPVYQWVHMELEAVFGITSLLSKETAEEIWQQANEKLVNEISVGSLLKQFNVSFVGTTDDPADCLQSHRKLSEKGYSVTVLPTFRPDRYHSVDQPGKFSQALKDLSNKVNRPIETFDDLLSALRQRHDDFHDAGCLMSDHGLNHCPVGHADISELNSILKKSLSGVAATPEHWEMFAGEILRSVARWNAEKNWTMQLHLGPERNVNSRLSQITGVDSGFDTMGSWPQTKKLISFLDELNSTEQLPKTIVYNLNPIESESICAALQNFQETPLAGKLQYGPAWWLLDHVAGIKRQLEIITNQSALGHHIGMLTDSRSFTSFVRHDYYRRILSSFLADKVISGEMPDNIELLTETARKVASSNASQYIQGTPIRTN